MPPFVESDSYHLYWQPFGILLILGILSGATLVVISMVGLIAEGYRSRRYLRHIGLVLGAGVIGSVAFAAAVGALALAFFADRPLDAKWVDGRLYRLTAEYELDDMGGVGYVLHDCVALGYWCEPIRRDSYWLGRPPPDRAWLELAPDGKGVVVSYESNPTAAPRQTAP